MALFGAALCSGSFYCVPKVWGGGECSSKTAAQIPPLFSLESLMNARTRQKRTAGRKNVNEIEESWYRYLVSIEESRQPHLVSVEESQ